MLESGTSAHEILTEESLNKLGRELVRLCDRVEQHGLVDYQMGVWEEEILSGKRIFSRTRGLWHLELRADYPLSPRPMSRLA